MSAAAASRMSGLEFLQAMGTGAIAWPPIMDTLGMEPGNFEVSAGKVVFGLKAQEFHFNPIGTVHGGVISTLLDSAMACAVQTMLPAGTMYTSLELKVNFTGALRLGSGLMRCEGKVLTMGRTIGTADGKLWDGAGKLCAFGTTTCLILGAKAQG